MNKNNIINIIKKVRENSKKRKFNQSFDLVINLKNLNAERKKQERKVIGSLNIIKQYLNTTYSSGHLQEITKCQEKMYAFYDYIKKEFGMDIPTYKEEDERLKEQNEILFKILQLYQVDQLIPKKELSERTGLSIKQLSAYTRRKDPLYINENKDNYKLVRPITKEQSPNEKFIGDSGNVIKDYEECLEEKLSSGKIHLD